MDFQLTHGPTALTKLGLTLVFLQMLNFLVSVLKQVLSHISRSSA